MGGSQVVKIPISFTFLREKIKVRVEMSSSLLQGFFLGLEVPSTKNG